MQLERRDTASVAFPKSSLVSTDEATRNWKAEWDSEQRMPRNCIGIPKQRERLLARLGNACWHLSPSHERLQMASRDRCSLGMVKQVADVHNGISVLVLLSCSRFRDIAGFLLKTATPPTPIPREFWGSSPWTRLSMLGLRGVKTLS